MQILEYRGTTIGFPDHFTEDDMAEVVSREESKAKNLAQLFMQEMGQSQAGGAAPRMGQGQDREFSNQEKLDMAATTTMGLPIVGDVAGLAADAHMYATDPASRNWLNYLFTAAGMLPFVPAASQAKQLASKLSASKMKNIEDFSLLRSSDDPTGKFWTPEPESAAAYRFNQGFGGGKTYGSNAELNIKNIEGDEADFLSEVIGDYWIDDYQTSAWAMEAPEVLQYLQDNGYDAIRFLDDFPDSSPTVFAPQGITGEEIDLPDFEAARLASNLMDMSEELDAMGFKAIDADGDLEDLTDFDREEIRILLDTGEYKGYRLKAP